MDFLEIAKNRQSCRNFDGARSVEPEKLDAIIDAAILAPSACNSQPYHFTVCQGEQAKQVVGAVTRMGANKFAKDVPVFIVISEDTYSPAAATGAKVKKNDFRSIDIGIATAYITAEATAQGLGSCIIGWLEDEKLREICGVNSAVRLVIAIGYAAQDDTLRVKKRKARNELVTE